MNDTKLEFDLTFTGNTDDDSNLDIFLDQNGTTKTIELESQSQNEPSEDQNILAGLQKIINQRYLNPSKIFVHDDSNHNHDFIHKNEDSFEFEYICEIPFPNLINQQNPNLTCPEYLHEHIPTSQDKTLDERVQNMLANYRCNLYSYEKDPYSMSRPLKKRRMKY